MKSICVLLAITYTLSCLRSDVRCTEAEADWLQTDTYRHFSDYRNIIWSYRNITKVIEEEACNQTLKDDGTIEFGENTDTGLCSDGSRVYKWHISVNDSDAYDVNVTISSLDLNENAGNYLIISPGPSLVQDEASVVITGEIRKPRMFRVVDHNEMIVLLVISEGITQDTWMDNNFKLSYEGVPSETPNTTTPTLTSSTTEPSADHDVTVYVKVLDGDFNETVFQVAVYNMAEKYCNETNITPFNLTGPDGVELSETTGCPMTWPNWERCVRIIMIVPVRDEPSYELTRSSLKEMWDMFADDKLKESGLEVFVVPDNNQIFNLWLPISLAVVAIFTLLMVAMWHFDIFNTRKKEDGPVPTDQRTSNLTKQSWVSSNSYQEVPPMTDLPYDDIYNELKENREITTSPNTLSVSHERPPYSEQFGAAYHFQRQGHDNPIFDLSSERHHSSKADYHDETSSDDDSNATRSTDTKSHQDHLHTAPKQVTIKDNKHESAV